MQSFDELGERFEGMETLWRETIEPALADQKKRRERNLILFGLLVIVTGALLYCSYLFAPEDEPVSVPVIVGAFIVFGMGFGYLMNDLKTREQAWITKAMEGLGLIYATEPTDFPLGRFRQMGVIPSYDRSALEDHIRGEHEGVAFELCEAELKEKRTTSSKNGTKTTYVTVFDGLLIRCGFQRSFTGITRIKRDGGFLGNLFSGGKQDRVRLEDPEFEKAFEVYSDDQVEARYLLNPGFMQRLLDLDRHLGSGNLALTFHEQEVWLSLRQKGDSFRMGGLFKAYSRESVAEFFQGLADLFHIIEELNRRERRRGA